MIQSDIPAIWCCECFTRADLNLWVAAPLGWGGGQVTSSLGLSKAIGKYKLSII